MGLDDRALPLDGLSRASWWLGGWRLVVLGSRWDGDVGEDLKLIEQGLPNSKDLRPLRASIPQDPSQCADALGCGRRMLHPRA